MNKKFGFLLVLMMIAVLAACGGAATPEATATLPPPEQVIIVSATPVDAAPTAIEIQLPALPDLPTSTPTPLSPTVAPATVTAVYATVEAAQATETAVPEANNGERVNATEAPSQAPVITNFFASSAPEGSGIRYFLNYDVVNANRVEIFGHVMDNPQTGSWAVYNESNNWVLWAANDVAWVESQLYVQPDHDSGSTMSDISLSSNQTTVCIKDPQFVDGDRIHILVNGNLTLNNFQTGGRDICGTANFQSGPNAIEIQATSEGQTPLVVVQLSFSNVSAGAGVQTSQALRKNEIARFTITAP
ncbi:MAG: hypothetical protein IAF02_03910 [Anaerolineae bacterium]|nr:hypothetical protein [Anaerolineae bacterium]